MQLLTTRRLSRRLALIAWLAAFSSTAHAQHKLTTLRDWGVSVHREIEETLGVPGTNLYAETASLSGVRSGGFNGRAYVWPAATQFRVLNSLVQHDPLAYTTPLRQFSDELRTAYWNNGYRSGAGGGDRFYDDNAHLVVSLAEAYTLTSDPVYLTRAVETYAFVKRGEDAAAGGGIYFKQFDFSSKDAISTLQGARGAAMLYRATGQASYLDDATRLLGWANSHIQLSDGLFHQGYAIANNEPAGVAIVNSAGIGISANLELFDATGEQAYLAEAKRIAARAVPRYFDAATGRINDEGYWAFELVDALNDLYLHDRRPAWRTAVHRALTWLHDNKQDPNGHYGLFWGRNGPQTATLTSWNLNEQASVSRAYLDSAITILPGDVNQDGLLTADDAHAFVTGWRRDVSSLLTLEKLQAGDFDLDGVTGMNDFAILQRSLNDAGVAIPRDVLESLNIPEPAAWRIMGIGGAIGWLNRRRRRTS